MTCRVLEREKKIQVSVRDLAQIQEFHHIGSRWSMGWSSLSQGSELHAEILAGRCITFQNYQKEIHLSHSVSVADWNVQITGRLDGVWKNDNGVWVVEEFKSSYGKCSAASIPVWHKNQLMLYCALWELLHPGDIIEGNLIYVDVLTKLETRRPWLFSKEKEWSLLLARLKIFCDQIDEDLRNSVRKREYANSLPFPHAAPRASQVPLIQGIERSLASGQILLAEAPTGIGKTSAALFGALKVSLAQGKRLAFLTSKTLQQNIAIDTARKINERKGFRSIQIRSKQKMCANGEIFCHEDFCPYARHYPEKMSRSNLLQTLTSEAGHYSPDYIFEQAVIEKVCPFEVQLEVSKKCDLLIADYNHVFDPGAALSELSEEQLADAILLVDEAHNLPERVRSIFSPGISEVDFVQLSTSCTRSAEPFFQEISQLLWNAIGLFFRTESEPSLKRNAVLVDPPVRIFKEFFSEWNHLFGEYLLWKMSQEALPAEDKVVLFHARLIRFLAVVELLDDSYRCLLTGNETGTALQMVCLDSARPINRILRQSAGAVFMSATLAPRTYYERLLGIPPERSAAISVSSDFPEQNRKIMVLPQIRTEFQVRKRYLKKIGELIAEMVGEIPGPALILFPSYQFLNEVMTTFPKNLPVVIQIPNLTEKDRTDIFARLDHHKNQSLGVFAVMGGMLAEGLDYPGNILKGVIVVSPGLPQLTVERDLLRDYFEAENGNGFDYAYIIPGMTKVIQAAGRLIRSESDFGVIALVCGRFAQDGYAEYFPESWFERSAAEMITDYPVQEIQKFFRSRVRNPGIEAPVIQL